MTKGPGRDFVNFALVLTIFTVVVHPGSRFELFYGVREIQMYKKSKESQIRQKMEKDKQIACREKEVGDCPDCSFEDEICQVFFTIICNGIDTM